MPLEELRTSARPEEIRKREALLDLEYHLETTIHNMKLLLIFCVTLSFFGGSILQDITHDIFSESDQELFSTLAFVLGSIMPIIIFSGCEKLSRLRLTTLLQQKKLISGFQGQMHQIEVNSWHAYVTNWVNEPPVRIELTSMVYDTTVLPLN